MWYLMESVANQREREIAARTRSPLFGIQAQLERERPTRVAARRRPESGRLRLPALSWGKWRHWAARPDGVHCSRAASLVGGC